MRALAASCAALLCACAPNIPSGALPVPDGEIAVVETTTGNRRVDVDMINLPAAHRYDPRMSTFMLWIVPPGGDALPVGELRYDPSEGIARAQAITPYDDFRVIVTAETGADATTPSGVVILTEDVRT
jgi:hypothetical protein